jgi:hypothetical protein
VVHRVIDSGKLLGYDEQVLPLVERLEDIRLQRSDK